MATPDQFKKIAGKAKDGDQDAADEFLMFGPEGVSMDDVGDYAEGTKSTEGAKGDNPMMMSMEDEGEDEAVTDAATSDVISKLEADPRTSGIPRADMEAIAAVLGSKSKG